MSKVKPKHTKWASDAFTMIFLNYDILACHLFHTDDQLQSALLATIRTLTMHYWVLYKAYCQVKYHKIMVIQCLELKTFAFVTELEDCFTYPMHIIVVGLALSLIPVIVSWLAFKELCSIISNNVHCYTSEFMSGSFVDCVHSETEIKKIVGHLYKQWHCLHCIVGY